MKLLTTKNPKVAKGEKLGYLTSVLHLAPSDLSGFNTCPMATNGCRKSCLNTAGRGGMIKIGETTNTIQKARIRKTRMFFCERKKFMVQLVSEITKVIKLAEKYELTPVFRLNGTSDIRWENVNVTVDGVDYPNVMTAFPNVTFYDYTKIPNRRNLPSNYFLTFSRADGNEAHCYVAISNGMNVAVVFRKGGAKVRIVRTLEERLAARDKRNAARKYRKNAPKKPYVPRKIDLSWIPETFMGLPTIHGDESDLRFLDPKGSIVALAAKGEAKYDISGFVVDVH